jgi:acyl-CoA reductase-like NAD-dependent aldehyde dehydrogenase
LDTPRSQALVSVVTQSSKDQAGFFCTGANRIISGGSVKEEILRQVSKEYLREYLRE